MHDYRDPVDYWDDEVLCHAPNHLYGESVDCDGLTDPGAAYIRDPADNLHITELPDSEGVGGYRWRNGALTIQLLSVDRGYTLQPKTDLPINKGKRFGGTYAKAFTITRDKGKDVVTDSEGDKESGLLYEATMYWHFGDLADAIQRGDPASIPCYGDPNWGSSFVQETRGLTEGQYQALYQDINPDILTEYDKAVLALQAALNDGIEADIQTALLTLAELLGREGSDYDDLRAYHRYRDYAPGNIPEQHLRDIDRDQLPTDDDEDPGDSTDDGIPVDVVDLEDLDTETVGPNFEAGRRTWTDLRM
jgi:hypothetical protein